MKKLIDQKRYKFANKKGVVYHQDKVRRHTALATQTIITCSSIKIHSTKSLILHVCCGPIKWWYMFLQKVHNQSWYSIELKCSKLGWIASSSVSRLVCTSICVSIRITISGIWNSVQSTVMPWYVLRRSIRYLDGMSLTRIVTYWGWSNDVHIKRMYNMATW